MGLRVILVLIILTNFKCCCFNKCTSRVRRVHHRTIRRMSTSSSSAFVPSRAYSIFSGSKGLVSRQEKSGGTRCIGCRSVPGGFITTVVDVRSGGFCRRGNISLGKLIHTIGTAIVSGLGGSRNNARNKDAVAVRLTGLVCVRPGRA